MSRFCYQILCTCESFRRNKRRKRREHWLEEPDGEIQPIKTEPEQHGRPWEDSHETVQIECEVRRRGRRGMVMSLLGRRRPVDLIKVHEAHHRSHDKQTRQQGGQYLASFEGRYNQHRHYTPSTMALLRPRLLPPGC